MMKCTHCGRNYCEQLGSCWCHELPENLHVYSPTELALKDKYCDALEKLNEVATQRDEARKTIAKLQQELGLAKENYAAIKDSHQTVVAERDEVIGKEKVLSTGKDAIERYKSIVYDLTPEVYKQYVGTTNTVQWRCLALNAVSVAKHQLRRLKNQLAADALSMTDKIVTLTKERDTLRGAFQQVLSERYFGKASF